MGAAARASVPRVGVTLPTFGATADAALAAAGVAEADGLDGVFAFDHLWPMGRPDRPALWSFGVLGAVAATTSRVRLGPLVARVGLLGDDDLVGAFRALLAIAGPDRVIAALGAGDSLSAAENLSYGVDYPPAAARLEAVGEVATRLRLLGLTAWIGGNSSAAGAVALQLGVPRNLWSATVEEVAEAAGEHGSVPLTWAGQVLVGRDEADLDGLRAKHGDRPGLVSGTVENVAAHLGALGRAGAEWCVCAPLDYLVQPERATETLCLVAEAVR
jgi:alkanesulfonate monooxygenase SsuD/methylene tetrahydromethanopterin reductase-like flavin-dependent oxidoreductase (luciferase family)